MNNYTAIFYFKHNGHKVTMNKLDLKQIESIKNSFIKGDVMTQNFDSECEYKSCFNLNEVYFIEFKK